MIAFGGSPGYLQAPPGKTGEKRRDDDEQNFFEEEGGSLTGQIDYLEEIIVDNFAGGGGASTGIELATGRPVTIAINHDPAAILMHKTNHPYTQHLQASVWDVDPEEVCAGRSVGLAWFSPDCKHFSKAKGAALVDRNIRGLAWIVLRWAGTVRPRVIILENVEEFITWGPVRKGKPIKSQSGQTFKKWLAQLQALGYLVEHRELIAADYGAPTTRKRFVLIARCDGKPIVWPKRTHAPAGSEEVERGECLPWRSAAEIIDWDQTMYSIFDSKEYIREKYGVNAVRPLANNTLRRIICGVDKYTIKSGNPFLVDCNHSGNGHVADIDTPVGTITQKCTKGVCTPTLVPCQMASAQLTSIGQTGGGNRIRDIRQPSPTTVSKQETCLVSASLTQYHTEKKTEHARIGELTDPLPTVDASNRHGLAAAHLTEYYGNGNPLDLRDPMHTATAHDREALTAVHIQKYFGGIIGAEASEPLPTVTAVDHNAIAAAHILEFKGQDKWQRIDRPLRTITTSMGNFGIAKTTVVQYEPGVDLGRWPQIRDLLNKYCGYSLAENEVLLLHIRKTRYFLSDISMRMLTPRELYAAMGFPPDYVIDRDYTGRAYPKSAQVARCGNAVCPPMASAVVRANMPEWSVTIVTMADFLRRIAV